MGSQKGYGWLSGAPIRPLAVRNIYDASRVVNIPIIGVGGVTCGRDAAEMLMAGASAVEVCTEAILKGPGIYGKIAKELNAFLDEHGYKDVKEIIGLSHKKADERTFRTEAIPPVVDNDKCIKCGQCRVSCVYDAITIEDVLKIDEDKCFGCGLCVYLNKNDTYTMNLGSVDVEIENKNHNIPITCRQSDIQRGKKISSKLKQLIIDKEFDL